jgi:hypothetical protein
VEGDDVGEEHALRMIDGARARARRMSEDMYGDKDGGAHGHSHDHGHGQGGSSKKGGKEARRSHGADGKKGPLLAAVVEKLVLMRPDTGEWDSLQLPPSHTLTSQLTSLSESTQ